MPKFFLHLRDHIDEVFDAEGVSLENMEAVKKAVLDAARDIMAGDLRNGLLDLRYRIDAQNEQGDVVYSLPFQHAVNVVPPLYTAGRTEHVKRPPRLSPRRP